MTTPAAPPPQQPTQPQQPGVQHPIADTVAAAAIAAALASIVGMPNLGSLPSADRRRVVTSSVPGQQITGVLNQQGVPTPVAQAVLGMTLGNNPIPHTSRRAPASDAVRRSTQATNLIRRAQYLANAAQRVTKTYRAKAAQAEADNAGGTVDALRGRRDALREALAAEQPYFRAHVQAQQQRNRASRQVDNMAAIHGDQLTWKAELDAKTSPYCRKADGKQFLASKPPPLGSPGAVHPTCRCTAAAPDRSGHAGWVYDVPPRD